MLTAPPDLPAAEIGIRSCLCLPLQAPGTTGALSLYAAVPHAFGAAQISRATTFACYLVSALVIGARQDGLLATVDQLRTALASRAVIEGVSTARHGTASELVGANGCLDRLPAGHPSALRAVRRPVITRPPTRRSVRGCFTLAQHHQ